MPEVVSNIKETTDFPNDALEFKQPDLSIVIPAYREEKRIGKSLDELGNYLRSNQFFQNKNVEVLVISAGTSDETNVIVTSKASQFARLELHKLDSKVGKGRDVRYGMLRASGKFIIFMDADLATPLHHLEEFYKHCQHENEIVIGTRNLHTYRANAIRRAVSIAGNVLFKLSGNVWIEDSQCGFKMFSEKAAKLCFTRLENMGWGFDMEILVIAKANELRIKTLRIDDWKDMPGSTFTDGFIITSIRSLKDLAFIVKNRLSGKYIAG